MSRLPNPYDADNEANEALQLWLSLQLEQQHQVPWWRPRRSRREQTQYDVFSEWKGVLKRLRLLEQAHAMVRAKNLGVRPFDQKKTFEFWKKFIEMMRRDQRRHEQRTEPRPKRMAPIIYTFGLRNMTPNVQPPDTHVSFLI